MSKSLNGSVVISQFKGSWRLKKCLGKVHFPLRKKKVFTVESKQLRVVMDIVKTKKIVNSFTKSMRCFDIDWNMLEEDTSVRWYLSWSHLVSWQAVQMLKEKIFSVLHISPFAYSDLSRGWLIFVKEWEFASSESLKKAHPYFCELQRTEAQ